MSTPLQRQTIYCTRRWRRLRQALIKKANYLCQDCGRSVPESHFDVHHKIPIEKCDDPFEQSNLQVICKACHRKAHCQDYPDKGAWDNLLNTI